MLALVVLLSLLGDGVALRIDKRRILPSEIVARFVEEGTTTGSLKQTVLCIEPACCSPDVSYSQKATGCRIDGMRELNEACRTFDEDFQVEDGVASTISRLSTTSEDTILVSWNVTWTPVSSLWLEGLGNMWPGIQVVPTPYTELSGEVSTFSWKAVFRLFADALRTKKLKVPQACIEGRSNLRFSWFEEDKRWKLVDITEDLSYAIDLNRGSLLNRKCANDLRLFLESGRRMKPLDAWEELVSRSLAWERVPGLGALDIDPNEEGAEAGLIFVAFTFACMTLAASLMAPELIGQSLFGSPTYVVPPGELNTIL